MRLVLAALLASVCACDDSGPSQSDLDALQAELNAIKARLVALEAQRETITKAEELFGIVSVTAEGDVVFDGANVYVQNGSGQTETVANGKGNLILGYDDIINGHELTLLFNQNGDTIVDVGVAGLDDIIEEPRLDVNITYKYMITDDLALKAKVKNLLDSAVKFTQGGKTFRSYEKGVELKVGIDWKF